MAAKIAGVIHEYFRSQRLFQQQPLSVAEHTEYYLVLQPDAERTERPDFLYVHGQPDLRHGRTCAIRHEGYGAFRRQPGDVQPDQQISAADRKGIQYAIGAHWLNNLLVSQYVI